MAEQQHNQCGCTDGSHLVDCAHLIRRRGGELVGRCVDCGVWATVLVVSAPPPQVQAAA